MKPFEKVLKFGDESELVSDLQERLISLGFTTCYIDDGVVGHLDTATGYFGEITREILSDFQAKVIDAAVQADITFDFKRKEEYVTGEMDYDTWYVLNYYESLSRLYKTGIQAEAIQIPEEHTEIIEEIPTKTLLIKKVIELAKGEIGVVEHGGNNYGKRVQEYQRIGSNGEVSGGQPYCQYFMNWLVITACKELGIEYKLHYSGYTPTWINWGKLKMITVITPKWEQIEIGDFLYVYSSARNNAKHVALIIGKNTNGTVTTIEGNTNQGGSNDGFGVFQRTRPKPWAIVKWHKLYD